MAPESGEEHGEARLYTREDESVRVEAHEDDGVWAVSIVGPGGEHRLRVFHEQATFDAFCAEHDRALLSKGFRPRARTERREDGSVVPADAEIPSGRRR